MSERERVIQLEQKIRQLRAAIDDPGPHPAYHREVLRRHRAEWPTLWRALQDLCNEVSR